MIPLDYSGLRMHTKSLPPAAAATRARTADRPSSPALASSQTSSGVIAINKKQVLLETLFQGALVVVIDVDKVDIQTAVDILKSESSRCNNLFAVWHPLKMSAAAVERGMHLLVGAGACVIERTSASESLSVSWKNYASSLNKFGSSH